MFFFGKALKWSPVNQWVLSFIGPTKSKSSSRRAGADDDVMTISEDFS